jgi:hypothetical protein
MNRRRFIKNTALAATMVGIAPSLIASDLKGGKKKKIVFIFRGVSFADAEIAFKKQNISDPNVHFQRVICNNQTFSHFEGYDAIIQRSGNDKRGGIQSQNLDRYKYAEIFEDFLNSPFSSDWVIHLHHTEIGHSSYKMYQETLDEFFTELKKVYNPKLHRFIVTADIGRNEKLNSGGGKDHSNSTCLETFVLYMGGKAAKLKSNTTSTKQDQILAQKF